MWNVFRIILFLALCACHFGICSGKRMIHSGLVESSAAVTVHSSVAAPVCATKQEMGAEYEKCVTAYLDSVMSKGYTFEAYQAAIGRLLLPANNDYVEGLSSHVEALAKAATARIPSIAKYVKNEQDGVFAFTVQVTRLLNRWLFVKEPFLGGNDWMTVSIGKQTQLLLPLVAGLRGARNANVLVAGCGAGDWALVLALILGKGSKVWCFNYLSASMDTSKSLMAQPAEMLFDFSRIDARKAVHGLARLNWLCSEHASERCSPKGFTYEVDKVSAALRVKFDAIVFGNSVKPNEIHHVRAALSPTGFAVLPVCRSLVGDSDPQRADYYCKGSYWAIRAQDNLRPDPAHPGPNDKILWNAESGNIPMRPIGANVDQVPPEHVPYWQR